MKRHGFHIVLEEVYEDSSLRAKQDALIMSPVIALASTTRQAECNFIAFLTLYIADLVLSKRFMPSGIVSTQTPLLHQFPRPRMRQIVLQEAQPDRC